MNPDEFQKAAAEYRLWIQKYLRIGHELVYLSQDDVKRIPVTPEEIRELTKKALIAYSEKKVDMPSKIAIHPIPNTFFHAMPCYVPEYFAAGLKWGSCYPDNRDTYGFPQAQGLIIFSDHLSGLPLSVLDCKYVTEIRTAAVTYVAIQSLAPKKVETFGMIGCGVEGTQHVRNIQTVLPDLKEIFVYDVFEKAADKLIAELQPKISAKIIKASSYEELVTKSKVVVSATIAKEGYDPVIRDQWVTKGQTILMCEGHTLYDDSAIKRADKYICDSRDQLEHFAGYGFYPKGWPTIHGETGEVAAGKIPGRERDDELIVCNNFGMAVEDMYVVRALFDRALENNIGVKLPL